MIGKDGVFGATQALDDKVSMHKVVVQGPGFASVVSSDHLKAVAQSSPDLFRLLLAYDNFFLGQVQQINAIHTVERASVSGL